MGQYHRMSEQLQSGVCKGCFCFQGTTRRPDPSFPKSIDLVLMPICTSTQQPLLGYCSKLELKQPSAASMRGNPTSIKISKAKRVMIGNREVEQLTFRDYLKYRRAELWREGNGH
jgi:hypothetical protein